MRFELRVFDVAAGQVTTRLVDAADDAAARAQVSGADAALLSIRALKSPAPSRSRVDVAWWCRELRTLVDAGMTVVEALQTLRAQALGPARDALHERLLQHLGQGRTLSDSMRLAGGFPPMLLAGVRAGERTSALVPALDDYLRYHDTVSGLQRRAVSAAIYPALVLMLGLAIVMLLLLVVVPRFASLYADLAAPPSTATRLLLWVSGLLADHRIELSGLLAAALLAATWAWRAGAMGWALGTLVDHVGPLRRRIDELRLAKLYRSLAMLVRGGYALDEALRQCQALGLGRRMQSGVAAASEALATGRRVSDAFAAGRLTDEISRRLLAVGDRSGNFERLLQAVADRHAHNFETLVERTTRLIEPALLLGVALVVGGLVLAMYMPIFDIAGSIR